jgi:hypothetical protein
LTRFVTIALTLLLASASFARAEPLGEEQAVEAGAEALQGPITFPWYDAEADGIRRIDVEPPADLKNRQSEWLRQPKQKKKKKKKQATNTAFREALWTFLRVLGWTAVAIAFVAIGYLLVRAFLMAETDSAGPAAASREKADPRGDVDRVESLPFQLPQPQDDLLSEARRHYDAGNFAEAIIYLLLRHTMLVFEDVFFGNHALERSRFESVWQELDTFHQGLEQALV